MTEELWHIHTFYKTEDTGIKVVFNKTKLQHVITVLDVIYQLYLPVRVLLLL